MTLSAQNQLRAGVTMEQIKRAIDRSGYPLQNTVEGIMRPHFQVQPEWGFFDRTTNDMRAIDILATKSLAPEGDRRQSAHVRPELVALVECKRSDLPFIFFSTEPGSRGNFPHFAGLSSADIQIKTDDDRSTWHYPMSFALGLESEPFLASPPATCATVSKCERKGGSDLILSGTDAYQGLVMPIRSAVEHFRQSSIPPSTYVYFDVYMIVGLAVLDAPMLSASTDQSGDTNLTFTPWQRLWRHEPLNEGVHSRYGESTAIDVVHKDFLGEYLENHLFPFANTFGERAIKHQKELATGKAFAKGMRKNSRTDIEPRLRARSGTEVSDR